MENDETGVAAGVQALPVTRDASFVRLSADHGFTSFLGADLELALLAVSNDLVSISARDNNAQADLVSETRFVELARVRLSPPVAHAVATNLLHALATAGFMGDDQADDILLQLKERIAAVGESEVDGQ